MFWVIVQELDFATLGINATHAHAAYLRLVVLLLLMRLTWVLSHSCADSSFALLMLLLETCSG